MRILISIFLGAEASDCPAKGLECAVPAGKPPILVPSREEWDYKN